MFTPRNHRFIRCIGMVLVFVPVSLVFGLANAQSMASKTNVFNDPFAQLTNQIAACPVPQGPGYTAEETREQAHYRAERGTSCYRSGRCRLPNAYLYDQEIIVRVQRAIRTDGHFENTSLWASSQRRWVTLQGCVHTEAESSALERLVHHLDDVESVINEIAVMP